MKINKQQSRQKLRERPERPDFVRPAARCLSAGGRGGAAGWRWVRPTSS